MYVDDVLILRNSTLAYNFIRDGRYGPAIDINTGLGYNNWSVDGSAIIARGDGVGLKGNLSFGWAF